MKRLLTSCFGLGWLPIAPGTWGSVPPVIIFILMYTLGAAGLSVFTVMIIIGALACCVCVMFSQASIEASGNKDPAEVVADEFAGQTIPLAVSVFLTPDVISQNQIYITALAGFLLFRFFDILKPWPIRKLEKLPAGWGILADDLLAGVYAAIGLAICLKLWIINFSN